MPTSVLVLDCPVIERSRRPATVLCDCVLWVLDGPLICSVNAPTLAVLQLLQPQMNFCGNFVALLWQVHLQLLRVPVLLTLVFVLMLRRILC
jgi:hypothetical protein